MSHVVVLLLLLHPNLVQVRVAHSLNGDLCCCHRHHELSPWCDCLDLTKDRPPMGGELSPPAPLRFLCGLRQNPLQPQSRFHCGLNRKSLGDPPLHHPLSGSCLLLR